MKRKRPLRVTITGILCILAGLIYLFPALGNYGVGDFLSFTGRTFQEGPFIFTALIVAIANFAIGIGCLYGWKPVWLYLVIISVVNFIFAAVVLLNMDTTQLKNLPVAVFWLAVATYVLISVQSKKTRTWFRV